MGDPSNLDIGWRSALLLALVLPLTACIALLWWRDVERVACRWLALFLLPYAMSMTPQMLGFAGFYTVWPGLTFAPFNIEMLIGPAIYLHTFRLTCDQPLGWRKWLMLPVVIQLSYYCWAFFTLGDYRNKWAYNEAFHEPWIVPLETIASVSLGLFGLIASFRLLRDYRGYLTTTQSTAVEFDPSWLGRLFIALPLGAVIWIGLVTTDKLIRPLSYINEYPAHLMLGVICLWVALEALSRIRTSYPKRIHQAVASRPAENVRGKDWPAEAQMLLSQLRDQQWYLEPTLSLREVARRLTSNETYVSRAINLGLNQNFNQVINAERVAHAQRMILTAADQNLLNVAFASGFRSKATFNRVFKQVTGQTPSQFRQSSTAFETSHIQ